jgi:hypothetical protein
MIFSLGGLVLTAFTLGGLLLDDLSFGGLAFDFNIGGLLLPDDVGSVFLRGILFTRARGAAEAGGPDCGAFGGEVDIGNGTEYLCACVTMCYAVTVLCAITLLCDADTSLSVMLSHMLHDAVR